jgi:predicted transposase YdaD
MQRRYDPLWKSVLEEVFDDFLKFVFPNADKELDLRKGFDFLDKELVAMDPEPENPGHTRYVDKLVKVFLRNGKERWILVHVEVQGYHDPEFSSRMFRYYYKILDRFSNPVTAIAIFSGADGGKMPTSFEDRCLGTRLVYQYNAIRVLDYPDKVLEQSENPFALVLLIVKKALLHGGAPDEALLKTKLQLARVLLEKGLFTKPKIRAVFTFLNNYIRFEKSTTYRIFEKQLDILTEKKNTMGIVEQVIEIRTEEFVENLLKETRFSVTKIASLANVSEEFVIRIKNRLKKR